MSLIQQRQNLLTIKNALPALKSYQYTNLARDFHQKNNHRSLSTQTGIKVNKLSYNTFSPSKENLAFLNAQFKCQQQRFYAVPTQSKNCWKCNAEKKSEDIFCEKCKTIQPLNRDPTYFSIFGIPKSFDVDLNNLKDKFLKLQQAVNPDNFSDKSDNEKLYAEQQSAHISKAYHTLADPLERAQYLLLLSGHPFGEGNNLSDVQFLMEIMTIKEFIESAESEEDVKDIAIENDARIDRSLFNLSLFFQAEHWEAAQSETIQLKYWKNIEKALGEWKPKDKDNKKK